MTAFERLGGEEGLRRLVDRFYDVMETDPVALPIRELHPRDLSESRRKLWMFLVGRFGGPPIYVQERGHPALRARHMPFPIGPDEAMQWVYCMDIALGELVPDEPLRAELHDFFRMVAEHMHNRSQDG